MAQHLYMRSPTLEGLWPLDTDGKLIPKNGKLIKIVNFEHGLTIPTASVRPSFSAEKFRQGQVEHAPMRITRALDSCSPYLIRAMIKRVVLEKVQVFSCEMLEHESLGEKSSYPTPVWIIQLGQVMITDFNYGPVESVGNGEAMELRYRSVDWFFRPIQLEDRQPGQPHTAGWNGELNKYEDSVADLPDCYDDLMTVIKG